MAYRWPLTGEQVTPLWFWEEYWQPQFDELDRLFAPLGNLLCEIGDDPEMEAEMEKDFERWNRESC